MQGPEEIKFSFFHQRFEEVVEKYPRRGAIRGDSNLPITNELSYDGLNNHANNLAASLLKICGKPTGKSIMATYLGRTIDTVMANIAIHKMGAGFLNIPELDTSLKGFGQLVDYLQQPQSMNDEPPFTISCIVTTSQLWLPIHKALKEKNKNFEIDHLVLLDSLEATDTDIHGKKTKVKFENLPYVKNIHCIKNYLFPIQNAPSLLTNEDLDKVKNCQIDPNHLAYIKYSSGTTGTRKAIMIRHSAIMSRIDSKRPLFKEAGEVFEYSDKNLENENVIQMIDHSVDASFAEMILALAYGACLHVVDSRTAKDIGLLWKFFEERHITTTILVPSIWRKLSLQGGKDGPTKLRHLKRILSTGEAANIPLIEGWLDVGDDIPRIVINACGPTECTFGVLIQLVTKENVNSACDNKTGLLSTGRPMAGIKLLIVERDPADKKCPDKFTVLAEISHNSAPQNFKPGITGELIAVDMNKHIAGNAIGYANNATKDKLSFIEVDQELSENKTLKTYPDSKSFGESSDSKRYRAYRTGDKVCLTEDMKLVILGRYDRQIKMNGRPPIDLEDLETLLIKAICIRKKINMPLKNGEVECKIFSRHQEFLALRDQTNPYKPYDDHHLVTFIKLKNDSVKLDESDLKAIFEYMYEELGNSIGIPTFWYQQIVKEQTELDSIWKENDSKYFIDNLWRDQFETDKQEGMKVITQCPPKSRKEDEIALKLAEIWKNLLFPKIKIELGPNSHFEMLGGNSVLASQMLAAVEKEYSDIQINIVNFSLRGTIDSLAKDVQIALTKNSNNIELRATGDIRRPIEELPVYLVPPPMGTEHDSYLTFRNSIKRRLAISWRTPGDSDINLASDDMSITASLHIAAMMKGKLHKKHQPYVIVGYSSGGVEAFEMARQLTSQDKNVTGYQVILVMIDSPCPALSQNMKFESYKKYMIKFVNEDLKLTLDPKVFKFNDIEFKPSEGLNSKQALIDEVKKFLLDNSCQEKDSLADKYQNQKITVITNYLKAELEYKLPTNVKLDFPIMLITSSQFRGYFSNDYEYESISSDQRSSEAHRLGWPEAWLTKWTTTENTLAQNPYPMMCTHFELMKPPLLETVTRESSHFISFAERIIQNKLLNAQISKMQVSVPKKMVTEVATQHKLLALTARTDICNLIFVNDQQEQDYNDENVCRIYIDHAIANVCLLKENEFLDQYFKWLDRRRDPSDKEIDKARLKQENYLVIYIDHIYDTRVLQRVYRALKNSENDKQGYKVSQVLYTIDPITYDSLNADFKTEFPNKDDAVHTDAILPFSVMKEIIDSEKLLGEPVRVITKINSEIQERFQTLAAQNVDYYEQRKETILSLALNYTLNLAAFIYEKSQEQQPYKIEEIDFTLLSPLELNEEDDFIYNRTPTIFREENTLLFAVRFCSPIYRLLKSNDSGIKKQPLYLSIIKDDSTKRVGQSKAMDYQVVNALISEFFRLGASTPSLLTIKKFESRLGETIESLIGINLSPLSEAWCLKVILESIHHLMKAPDDQNKAKLNYLIKSLLCISQIQSHVLQNHALSLVVSLLKIRENHGALFDMCFSDKIMKVRGIRYQLLLSCQKISSRVDLTFFEPVKNGEAAKIVTDNVIHDINFSFSIFRNIKFKDCDFIDINFDDCSFIDCTFENCTFKHCSMANTKFVTSESEKSIKNFTTLFKVNFDECFLEAACFDDAVLNGCAFKNCDVTDISLKNVNADTITIDSFTRNKLSSDQFSGMTGKGVTIPIGIISPRSISYFSSDPSRYDLRDFDSHSSNRRKDDIEKLMSIKGFLENPKPVMMGLEKYYVDLLRKPIREDEEKFISLNQKARAHFLGKKSDKPAPSPNVAAQIPENKILLTKTKVVERFQTFKSKAKGLLSRGEAAEKPGQVELKEIVKETQIVTLEVQRSNTSSQKESNLFEMGLVHSVKFTKSDVKPASQQISLSEDDQNKDKSRLRLSEYSMSSSGICWVYRPVISSQNKVLDSNLENVLYANIVDALSMAACNSCKRLPCQCDKAELMQFNIQIIRVNSKDIQLLSARGIQQRFKESVFEINAGADCHVIGTLEIVPNPYHPFFFTRASLTQIPTSIDYKKSLIGKVCIHFNEMMKLLEQYSKAIGPFFVSDRIAILQDINALIDIDPILAQENILDKAIVDNELSFLQSYQKSNQSPKLPSKVFLMAICHSQLCKKVKISADSYGQVLIEFPEADKKILDEIEMLDAPGLPVRSITQAESSANIDLQYAQSYYQTSDHEVRTRILNRYMSSNNIPCLRLLINRTGRRFSEFNYLTDISLLKLVEKKDDSDQRLSVSDIAESFLDSITGRSQSADESCEVYYVSEETPAALKECDSLEFISVDLSHPKAAHLRNDSQALKKKINRAFGKSATLAYFSKNDSSEVELHDAIPIAMTENKNFGYISFKFTTNMPSADRKVAFKTVSNPMQHFVISSLLRRIHGLVPDSHYGIVLAKKPFSVVVCEDLKPVQSFDDIRRMGDYSLTLKLFEICILGRHDKRYIKSYAAKKSYFSAPGIIQHYPAFTEKRHNKDHEPVKWSNFYENMNGPISELAIAELEFLDPEMVINYWNNDNEIFEKLLVERELYTSRGINHWKRDFPKLITALREQFLEFRDWLLANKSNKLSYADIWRERAKLHAENSYVAKMSKSLTPKDIWSQIRVGIWNNHELYHALETAMANGDEKLLNELMKKISPKMMLRFLREFELVNTRLGNVEKLLNKIMETNYTHIALNNPSQAMIETLKNSANSNKIESIELINCDVNTSFDAKEFTALKRFEVSGTASMTLSNFKEGTTVELDEATRVSKFLGGDTAVLLQVAAHTTEDAVVTVNDPDQCVIQAKLSDDKNEFKKAKILAKAALEDKKDDSKLKSIYESNEWKENASQYVLKAISANDCARLDTVLTMSKLPLVSCVHEETLNPALLSALAKGHDDIVAHVLSLNIPPFLDLLISAIKNKCDKATSSIINSGKLDINHVNDVGISPLTQAIMSENVNAVGLLLDKGAVIGTHLAQAVDLNANESIVKMLLEKATIEEVNCYTSDDVTLLEKAAIRKQYDLVKSLCEREADVRQACLDSQSGLEVTLSNAFESLPENDPTKGQVAQLLNMVKAANSQLDFSQSEEESQEPEISLYLRSLTSGDSKTLAIIQTKSITLVHLPTRTITELTGEFYETDVVTLDEAGQHLLIYRQDYLVLIRVLLDDKNPSHQVATLGDDSGLLGACLSNDGQYLIYCLNDSSEMPYKVYKTDHLLEDGAVELSEIPRHEVSSKADSCKAQQIALSHDLKYFAAVDGKVIRIGLVENEQLSLIDQSIPLENDQQYIFKLQFTYLNNHYQLATLSESSYDSYALVSDPNNENVIICESLHSFGSQDIPEDNKDSNPVYFDGTHFKDFALSTTGETLMVVNHAKKLYSINVETGDISTDQIENCDDIQLFSDLAVVFEEKENVIEVKCGKLTPSGFENSNEPWQLFLQPILGKQKKKIVENKGENFNGQHDSQSAAEGKESAETPNKPRVNSQGSSPGRTPQSLFNQQKNLVVGANAAQASSSAASALQAIANQRSSKRPSGGSDNRTITLGDGNCAYNAAALGLCLLIHSDKLPPSEAKDKIMAELLYKSQNDDHLDIKQVISDLSDDKKQKMLAPVLRKLAITYIRSNYQRLYSAGFREKLKDEYYKLVAGSLGDMFCVHPQIVSTCKQIRDRNGTFEEVLSWWEKEGHIIYFDSLLESARYAYDRARWGSEIEMDAIAIVFGINIRVEGQNLILGVNGGFVPDLPQNVLHTLLNLDIGEKYNGVFRLHLLNKEQLTAKLKPINEVLCAKVMERIRSNNSRQCTNFFDPAEENVLLAREILQPQSARQEIRFIGNDDIIDIERITLRLQGAPAQIDKLCSHLKENIPDFWVKNPGGHWSFTKLGTLSQKSSISTDEMVKKFIGSTLRDDCRKYENRYSSEIIQTILNISHNSLGASCHVLPDEKVDQPDMTYVNQVSAIVKTVNDPAKPLLIVSNRPGSTGSAYFVLTLICNKRLYFINPVGLIEHLDMYVELNKLIDNVAIEKVILCGAGLLQDYSEDEIPSCGPLVVEIARGLMGIKDRKQFNENLQKTNNAFQVRPDLIFLKIDLSSLLSTVYSIVEQLPNTYGDTHREILESIRASHYKALNSIDPPVINTNIEMDAKDYKM